MIPDYIQFAVCLVAELEALGGSLRFHNGELAFTGPMNRPDLCDVAGRWAPTIVACSGWALPLRGKGRITWRDGE